MRIRATVASYVTVYVDVPEDATTEQKKQAILDVAARSRDMNDPIITDCTDEDCID